MGGESGPCRKSLRARREVQVGQEGDSSMTWSNRERMGDRVGERVTEQCKLKWDGMVPPTRIERATRGLGNRPGQFFKMLGVSNGFPIFCRQNRYLCAFHWFDRFEGYWSILEIFSTNLAQCFGATPFTETVS